MKNKICKELHCVNARSEETINKINKRLYKE